MSKIFFDLRYKRNFWEASLFFVVNTICMIIFGSVFAYFYVMFGGSFDSEFKDIYTPVLSGLYSLVLSSIIVYKKGLIGINKWTGLVALSTWIAYSLAGFAGILISSILTTTQPKRK